MNLYYDENDDAYLRKRGSQTLYWLDDIGAKPLTEAGMKDAGFLFSCARTIDAYRKLVENKPLMRDRPEEREPLLSLDLILDRLEKAGIALSMPRTWQLSLGSKLPSDLSFPLFLRTIERSWKLGGKVSKVRNSQELETEAAELRRALGWDAVIMARQWLDLAVAGDSIYGPIPQEVRTWIVDGIPIAWSFHHLHAVPDPKGFPPSDDDLRGIAAAAAKIGKVFQSRLIVADFVRLNSGAWMFLEAGPGSCAGTAHESVYKAVAQRLLGSDSGLKSNMVGGRLAIG